MWTLMTPLVSTIATSQHRYEYNRLRLCDTKPLTINRLGLLTRLVGFVPRHLGDTGVSLPYVMPT